MQNSQLSCNAGKNLGGSDLPVDLYLVVKHKDKERAKVKFTVIVTT